MPDGGSRANILHILAHRLSYAGRLEECLTAGREAVELSRALAADKPAVFNGLLADSLSNLAIWLAIAGRTDESATAGRQAADIRLALASEH